MNIECSVYVKTNAAGYIIAVNSSAFLDSPYGWIKMDTGFGDKFHHAQGNYFPEPIFTAGGAYRYKLSDGIAVECSAEEVTAQEAANLPSSVPSGDSSVWNELDAAYQEGYDQGYTEGVNSAYDQ